MLLTGGQQAEPFGGRAGHPFKFATAKMIALQFVESTILPQPAFFPFVIMIDSTNLVPEGSRVIVDQQVAEFVQDEIRENRCGQHDRLPMQVESPGFRARSPAETETHDYGFSGLCSNSPFKRGEIVAKPVLCLLCIPADEEVSTACRLIFAQQETITFKTKIVFFF